MIVKNKLLKSTKALHEAAKDLRFIAAEKKPAPHVDRLLRIAEEVERRADALLAAVDEQDREEAVIDAEAAAFCSRNHP